MIVDCHTHIWEHPDQLGEEVAKTLPNIRPIYHSVTKAALLPDAGMDRHYDACEPIDKAIVLGFRSRYLKAHIPNEFVAQYVRQHPDKLVGFAGIDPTDPDEAIEDMRAARENLGLRGLAVAPAAQNFHPMHSHALWVYQEAAKLGLPMLFHQGLYFSAECKMEYARPALLDDVAREFPDLRIVVAHLGYPWVDETVVLIGKHANVFADISGLLLRPWQAYNTLLTAYQFGVMDKLVFGSDFPYTSPAHCIEALYSINHICHGTSLPTLPREKLRAIVERDTLGLLGVRTAPPAPEPVTQTTVLDTEDA
jgi:predicted TIM-barrel fold metal-dependent hydrolase